MGTRRGTCTSSRRRFPGGTSCMRRAKNHAPRFHNADSAVAPPRRSAEGPCRAPRAPSRGRSRGARAQDVERGLLRPAARGTIDARGSRSRTSSPPDVTQRGGASRAISMKGRDTALRGRRAPDDSSSWSPCSCGKASSGRSRAGRSPGSTDRAILDGDELWYADETQTEIPPCVPVAR